MRGVKILKRISIPVCMSFPRSLSPKVVVGERESSINKAIWTPASAGVTIFSVLSLGRQIG